MECGYPDTPMTTRPYSSLGAQLDALEAAGELRRVAQEYSPLLEITVAANAEATLPAASRSQYAARIDPEHDDVGGSALLFENVTGSDFPLAINTFGSYRRMEMSLGCSGFDEIAARIASLVNVQPPQGIGGAFRLLKDMAPLSRIGPRRKRGRGACQEVICKTIAGEVDLHRLPIMKCWPADGDPRQVGIDMTPTQCGTEGGEGRFITFAGMHTIHADDRGVDRPASHNIGMYRAQLLDGTRLAMHWHMHHDGAAHWRSWKAIGEPMPIAICFGGPSVLPYAATAPLPPGISELLMAGFLNGRGIEMVKATTVDLWVPAACEIVIEGFVNTECGLIGWDPDDGTPLGPGAVYEGPFGDHTGYYSMPDRYPIVDVTAITHRENAVYPSTIVGLPPQEDYYLGKATERIFLPLLKVMIPDIDDYHLPLFGCFHNAAFVAIKKAYPMQARRVMHAIWGAGQMAWTKLIIVVDSDVDVHREEDVWAAVAANCRFDRDLEQVHGPLDILDHAAPQLGVGSKLGIDATTKVTGEGCCGVNAFDGVECPGVAPVAERVTGLAGTASLVQVHVPEVGQGRFVFATVEKSAAGQGIEAIEAIMDACDIGAELVIVVDDDCSPDDRDAVLFRMTANADWGRDVVRRAGRMGIDATRKRSGDARNGWEVRRWPVLIEGPELTVQGV
jgi:4-hydroxy-3-polyprenylbenzoate decarboxylase